MNEMTEFFGFLFHLRKGVIMHGNDLFGIQEFDRSHGIVGVHGIGGADGKKCKIDIVSFGDQFHVPEK